MPNAGEGEESKGMSSFPSALTTAMDTEGFAISKAQVIQKISTGSFIEGNAVKAFTRSGTVIGAIAGAVPAIYSMTQNGVTWRNSAQLGLAVLGVVSEFTGLGELWDGTVGLGIAAASVSYDIYDLTHPE